MAKRREWRGFQQLALAGSDSTERRATLSCDDWRSDKMMDGWVDAVVRSIWAATLSSCLLAHSLSFVSLFSIQSPTQYRATSILPRSLPGLGVRTSPSTSHLPPLPPFPTLYIITTTPPPLFRHPSGSPTFFSELLFRFVFVLSLRFRFRCIPNPVRTLVLLLSSSLSSSL